MSRFLVRVLDQAEIASPTQLLAALPAASCPVLLDSSDGAGACLLAWSPDRRLSGRVQPVVSVRSTGVLGAKPWPLADVDPGLKLQQACADEHWSAEYPNLPLWGGWIGYFSFECAHAWESFPWQPADPAGFDDYHFARYRQSVVFQPGQPALLLWAEDLDASAQKRQQQRHQLRAEFRHLLQAISKVDRKRSADWQADLALAADADQSTEQAEAVVDLQPVGRQQNFCQAVRQLREWIGQGELFQANLSHRLVAPAPLDPRTLYARLRPRQPTSMSAYWEGPDGRALLSWSPERFLSVRGEHLETRPIKGTAARGLDPQLDLVAAADLDASEKERAELTMIVDMARNDLGRVALPGQVHVETAGQVEAYPTLFHRTAIVRARWNPALGLAALLRATLPPASVTGAPKVRALQAIAELEDTARGPYCGAFGYWIPGQSRADFSVLIRTATHRNGQLSHRVGAGIVWDSQAESEWQETLVKARYLTEQNDQVSI